MKHVGLHAFCFQQSVSHILLLCVGNTNFLPKEREESLNIALSDIFLEVPADPYMVYCNRIFRRLGKHLATPLQGEAR